MSEEYHESFGEATRRLINAVGREATTPRKYFINYGWPFLNEVLLGLKSGVVLIASPANFGKSAFMVNLIHKIIGSNQDIRIVDFSLDDEKDQRVHNTLAMMSKVSINESIFAFNLNSEEKKRWISAGIELKKRTSQLEIMDASDLDCKANNLDVLLDYSSLVKDNSDGKPLIISIDGFHNIRLRQDRYGENQNAKQEYISSKIKEHATVHDIIFLCTAQTRKGSRRRGTSTDDVLGSGSLGYDANVIATLFNDVKVNKMDAIVKIPSNDPYKPYPVLELDITKCKASGFSGILFYGFEPERCRIWELDSKLQDSFTDILYSPGK